MFVNTLVLRTEVKSDRDVRRGAVPRPRTDLAAFGHAEVPFESVVDALAPGRSTAYSPLFQVMLEFQNTATARVELPGLTVEVVDVEFGVAKFDLQLTLAERYDDIGERGRPLGGVHVRVGRIRPRDRGRGSGSGSSGFCEGWPADPDAPVGDVEMLVPGERELVVESWNATARAVPAATLAVVVGCAGGADPGRSGGVVRGCDVVVCGVRCAGESAGAVSDRGGGGSGVVGGCGGARARWRCWWGSTR